MRHPLLTRRHRLLLLATIAFVAPGQLLAQDGAPTVLEQIEVESESGDILVQDGYVAKSDRIGTKTDTPLVEIPQAISAITRDQIEDQQPRSLPEAMTYTASANVGTYGFDSRYDVFFLRGFPAYYTGTFRDSLRQFNPPTAIFKNEPYGIEGVTILKGPSSALYGNSGPGGIVNIMTKRPKDEIFREAEIIVGQDDRYQANFDVSGPASENEAILYRMTGVVRKANSSLPGFSDDKVYLAPALTFKPDEDTSLTILGEYTDATTGGTAASYNPGAGQVSRRYNGDPNYNDFRQKQGRIGYELEHRLNDTFTVRQNARFSAADADMEYSGWYRDATPPYSFQRYWGHYGEKVSSFVIDNQIQAEYDTGPVSHVSVAGLDYGYSRYRLYEPPLAYAVFPPAGIPLYETASQEMNQLGVYLHEQAKWNNLTLFATGRYDWIDSDSTIAGAGTTNQQDEAFSKRIGLSYTTPWGITPYASYSTSFSPNIGFVREIGSNIEKVALPTEAHQTEFGVKYELPGYNATISAAYFDIRQDNGVVFDVIQEAGEYINVQRQLDLRSRGFEIEGSMTLDNGLGLIASYTHLKMEILRGVPGTEGNELSGTPNNVFALWAHYLFEDDAMAGVGLGAGVRYSSGSFGDDLNTFRNDSRVFVDAAVSYDFGYRNPDLQGLSLQVNVKNLFDERKSVCSAGYCYWDEGRTVIGSLRYRF